jgi:hypothetical protein
MHVVSSGKGLGLCSIPIKSKVQIPLDANNSLDQLVGETEVVLPDLCEGGTLHWSEVYPTGIGTRSDSTLEEFLIIKRKNNNKKRKRKEEGSLTYPYASF